MKTIIFFLFSFITYVFSAPPGPLFFGALMPPYRPLESKHPESNLISGHYGYGDLLLFLTNGQRTRCLLLLENVCGELTKTYSSLSTLGNGLETICNNQYAACWKLSEIKKELCDINEVTFESQNKPLDSTQCFESYLKCRLRSLACSNEYMEQCRKLLSECHHAFNKHGLLSVFANLNVFSSLNGRYYSSETLQRQLRSTCRRFFSLSDLLVQLCLNSTLLLSDLKDFILRRQEGEEGFHSYPKFSPGALLKALGLDGGFFSPQTDPLVDSDFFMGYLVGQSGSTSFTETCISVSKKCSGLGFFSRSDYFCNHKSETDLNNICQTTDITLLQQKVPELTDELKYEISSNQSPKGFHLTGINANLCRKHLSSCSYLMSLDKELHNLCVILQGFCSYYLEIGSSLSIFEYYTREQNLHKQNLKDSNHEPTTCEQKLGEVCRTMLNTSVDFLAFCLRPSHTCTALQQLASLRCSHIKKGFADADSTEEQCINLLLKYDVYKNECEAAQQYPSFLIRCSTKYPLNDYLKQLAASTLKKESTSQEDMVATLDDGF